MKSVPKPSREPVAYGAAAAVVVNLLLVFGVELDVEQVAAVNTAVLLVGSWLVRRRVSPVA